MVNYLFDTNIIIDYGRGYQPTIDFLFEQLDKGTNTYISVITEAELYTGKSFEVLDKFIAEEFPAESISIDSSLARQAGTLRRQYSIDIIDALIAATALIYNLTLVTRNTKHFQNIPALRIPNPS